MERYYIRVLDGAQFRSSFMEHWLGILAAYIKASYIAGSSFFMIH